MRHSRTPFGSLVVSAALMVVTAIFPPAALAAEPEDPHAACAAPPSYVPAEILERPVGLRTGVGNSHEKVTTASSEAQAFYDQGLNYLESYVWIEASRSFQQALRLDPGLAMAYVGLSRTQSGLDNPKAARLMGDKAKELADKASPRERRIIEIRQKQLAAIENIDDAALFAAYKKSIDEALGAHLDDPQLWLLRGMAEETNASGRGQRGTASSVAFYEQVLRLVPDHASAHHYLIHSYETIGQIDKALVHGEAYARLSPSIPHASHMWAHDLRRVGRTDEAIAQFLRTDELERAWYKAEGLDPALDWHHGHNLDLLASCYTHKGQMKLAEKTLREAEALGAVDAYRAFNLREMPSFLLHRGRYAEALESALKLTQMEYPQARATGHALAGQAQIGLRRLDEAAASLEKATRELETVPATTIGLIPRRAAVMPWVEALRGELLLRNGKIDEGSRILQEVQRAMRGTPGPDAWSQALFRLETIARSARETGAWDLAEHTAAQMLEHDAAYGGSHLAMALVLQKKSDTGGAVREMETARRYWTDADPDLPELSVITATLASAR